MNKSPVIWAFNLLAGKKKFHAIQYNLKHIQFKGRIYNVKHYILLSVGSLRFLTNWLIVPVSKIAMQ